MKILINVLSAKEGGGLIYLENLIDSLEKIVKKDEMYVLIGKYNFNNLYKKKFENTYFIKTNVTNTIHRLLYEQFIIPIIVKKKKINILYSPAEIISFFAPCYKVLGVQNSNIYYDIFVKRTIKERLRYILLKFLAKISMKKSDKIITVSEEFKRQILKVNHIPNNKIIFIHHGIHSSEFSKDYCAKECLIKGIKISQFNYILCVAHLWRHKNIEVLIDAYKKLDSKLRVKYKLIVVGEKETSYYKELMKRSEKRELNKDIIFLGNVNHQDIKKIYTQADLFVFPSKLESFGIPLIEAMASGVPIIASNTTAIPEVLADAGLLFNSDDSDELAVKIDKVLTNKNLRRKLIDKGQERVQNFSWKKTARKTLKVFEEVYNG